MNEEGRRKVYGAEDGSTKEFTSISDLFDSKYGFNSVQIVSGSGIPQNIKRLLDDFLSIWNAGKVVSIDLVNIDDGASVHKTELEHSLVFDGESTKVVSRGYIPKVIRDIDLDLATSITDTINLNLKIRQALKEQEKLLDKIAELKQQLGGLDYCLESFRFDRAFSQTAIKNMESRARALQKKVTSKEKAYQELAEKIDDLNIDCAQIETSVVSSYIHQNMGKGDSRIPIAIALDPSNNDAPCVIIAAKVNQETSEIPVAMKFGALRNHLFSARKLDPESQKALGLEEVIREIEGTLSDVILADVEKTD